MVNCKVRAPCCPIYYCCRFCHDEASEHKIDRYAICEMICSFCFAEQPVGQKCNKCEQVMAHYYCSKCKLHDHDQTHDIYHCDDCKLCRRGNQNDFVHCKKCNLCFSNASDHDKCIPGAGDANCPVCTEDLFSGRRSATFLQCGHGMHHDCLISYAQTNYNCPLCKKTFGDRSFLWAQIQSYLESNPMPPEYQNFKATIFCNDCVTQSEAPYHFAYHKCVKCGGYNTTFVSKKLIETVATK